MRVIRERVSMLALLAVAGAAWISPAPAGGQEKTDQEKTGQEKTDQEKTGRQLTDAQRAEAQKLVQLVDAAMAGREAPSDIAIEWKNDFLKAQKDLTYVPFTLTIDPDTLASSAISFYLRLARRGEPAAEPVARDANDGDGEMQYGRPKEMTREQPAPPTYAFEDVYFVKLRPAPGGKPYRISRAFAVPGGDYDIYLALKDSELVEGQSEEIKRTVLKRSITVPDFWTDELTTSTIFMTKRVEPIASPLSPEQQRADPYAIGTARIIPRTNLEYEKTGTCSFLFFIYNPKLDGNHKPNVTIEYSFQKKTETGEEFFNKTSPQTLSAETLPPQFDMTAGHQLSAGQNVPLSTFPEGAYRLEIKVTDNESGDSVTRDVNFMVAGS